MRIGLLVLVVACSSTGAPGKPAAPSNPAVATRTDPGAGPGVGLEPSVPTLRLPRNFAPTSYAATLALDPARDDFDGTIAITGDVAQRSSVIWLHGRKLAVRRASATRGGAEIAIRVTPHGEELLELRAAAPLDPGSWTIAVDYTGSYDLLSTAGAFKQVVNGAPYVYSQFEALYARRVFPCLDEPDSKVPWQLTLDVPADLVAVSNTPIVREQTLGGGKKRVLFGQTKPLPSYLVAFGVGPFDVVDAGKTRGGTPVRVLAMKGRAADTAYAAKTSAKLIELGEEFFGSPYPYAKMDMLAIPVTVGFGAMENAGLITFEETIILIDPRHGSRRSEYRWIVVAAHELAHQWFGDLVTTAWWDDIWLNEGFANWTEHKISARFEPGWHEDLAELDMRRRALGADSLVTARQVRQPITGVDDILNAFDGITYDKGASVLNMFEGYLGHDVFLRGVRDHLAAHALGNATSREFAAAISKAAGKDIAPALATFLEQPGAPEIAANLVCDRDRPPRIAVTQQRYLPPGAPPAAATRPWAVPVCAVYERGGKRAEACGELDAAAGEIALDTPSCPRWVMANLDGRGYYHTAYTAAQVTALRDHGWAQLSPRERMVLFDDVSDAALHGKLPLAVALSFVPRQLAIGDRFSVGGALGTALGLGRLVPADLRAVYQTWLGRTFGAAARKAGLTPRDSDSLDVETMREDLIRADAIVARDPVIAAEAVRLSERWRDLPEGIRGTVLAIAADTSAAVFERLRQDLFHEPDRARRGDLIWALSSVHDVAKQTAVLGLMLDPRLDVRETMFSVFAGREDDNIATVQRFIRDHQAELFSRIPSDSTTGGLVLLARPFGTSCTADRRDEVADYLKRTFASMPGGERTVQQLIERMDQCIATRTLLEPEIRAWLGDRTPTARR